MSDRSQQRRQEIKKELRRISADPAAPGAALRVQQLRAEYRRLGQSVPEAAVARRQRRGGTNRSLSPWRD